MGGSSVPSSTSQYQQVATGIWGSPQATKLALPILKPALANIKNQQDMLMGFQKGDPEQTRKFLGLPTDAPAEEAVHAIGQLNKPVTSQAQFQQPPKAAAHGGIMSLEDEPARDPRKFASGGDTTPKDITKAQETKLGKFQQIIDSGKKLNPSQQRQYDAWTGQRNTFQDYTKQQGALKGAATQAGLAPSQAYINQSGYFGFDPEAYKAAAERGDLAGVTTNPLYAQAIRQLQSMEKQPEQFGQATQAYTDAISGLKSAAGYTPQQVQAQQIEAANIARGDIRDVSAQQARTERMRGGPNVRAIQAQTNQMAQPSDVTGQTYQAANIAPTQRETAQQIGDIGTIQGQGYTAEQMRPVAREQGVTTAAPKTWTDPGVAQQYMNPYAQAVINQNVQEANRNFMKNLSGLRGQAAKSKAYGGSRQGLEEAEALRNQGYLLADIQDKGLSQAYTQGMGQFQAEQGLGSQVGMSNTAQINQLKSQYMQMGMTEAQANQAAINQAQQFTAAQGQAAQTQNVANQLASQQANAQMVNQLKSQYMSMGLSEAQANQMAQNQASQFGAQSAQQAALANQQAGLTTGQANLSAAQQTALANQQAGMTAQQLNQLYGQGGFQTQAANQAAQNQAYNNYVQQQLQAQLQNQGMDFNTAQQNAAMLMQQRTANQQAALQAALANQQAGLQANQQNIGALSQIGNMGQGLGALGTQIGNYGQNLSNMWGQAGGTLQGLGQNWYNQQTQNAGNIWGGPTSLGNQGMNLLGGMGGGQSGYTGQTTKQG